MKPSIRILITAALLLAGSTLMAQNSMDKIFEKYNGQDGFTTVNFSKEMFQMFQQMAPSKDSSAQQVKDMLSQLTGLKVLMFNFDSTQMVKAVSVYNEFASAFPSSTFKELMTVQEGRKQLRFLTKQDGAGKISELVMLIKDKDEVGVITLSGNIELATISKLTSTLHVEGMENLEKVKEKKK
jgi:hypothetical protein